MLAVLTTKGCLGSGRQWVEQKRIVADCGNCWETASVYKRCGSYFCLERVKGKKFLDDAKKEQQEGIQGQWQQESPATEFLDQVRRCADTDCIPQMMRFGYLCIEKRKLGGVQKNLQS